MSALVSIDEVIEPDILGYLISHLNTNFCKINNDITSKTKIDFFPEHIQFLDQRSLETDTINMWKRILS